MVRKYLFTDESGNFDFRDHRRYPGATRYFAVGTMMVEDDDRVKALAGDLHSLRLDLLHRGIAVGDFFHASEDKDPVREAVFDVLKAHDFRLDVTILEKSKALPRIRSTNPLFYKYAWFFHFKHLASQYLNPGDELVVVSSRLGQGNKMRRAMQSSVEDVVAQCCSYEVPRRFAHWSNGAEPCLQAADYGLWAVMRRVDRGDGRWEQKIAEKVRSSYDLWDRGTIHYYGEHQRPQ